MLGVIAKKVLIGCMLSSFVGLSWGVAQELPLPAKPTKKYRKAKNNFDMRKYDPETKKLVSDPTKREALPEITDDMSNGQKLFISKGCVLCHKKKSSRLGPSLKKIKRYYKSKQERLINYLTRKEKPIINPKRQAMMRAQLAKLTILSKEELQDLSGYMIGKK